MLEAINKLHSPRALGRRNLVNTQPAFQVCEKCNTPTILGCACTDAPAADVGSFALPDEPEAIRFGPADEAVIPAESWFSEPIVDPPKTEPGHISQETIFAGSKNSPTNLSSAFQTFIEKTGGTVEAMAITNKIVDRSRLFGLLRTTSLIALAAFLGGFAVFLFSPEKERAVTVPTANAQQPAGLITSESLLPKPTAASGAEERLVPETPGPVEADQPNTLRERQSIVAQQKPADPAQNTNSETAAAVNPEQPTAEASTQPAEPQKEAKVGGYATEKLDDRKPLARCADGTYSYSASRGSACSQRGGVSEWLGSGDKPDAKNPAKQAAYILGPRGGCYYLDSSNKKVYVEKKYCN